MASLVKQANIKIRKGQGCNSTVKKKKKNLTRNQITYTFSFGPIDSNSSTCF